MRFRYAATLVTTICLAAGSGCGGSPQAGPVVPPLRASVRAMPDGTAQVTQSASNTSLKLALFGLPSGQTVNVSLRRETCLKPANETVHAFGNVTPDGGGHVVATLQAQPATQQPLVLPLTVVLSLSGTTGGADQVIGCTDLSLDPTVAVRMYPDPSVRPGGAATLAYDSKGRVLNVDVSIIAMPPDSRYTGAVYSGKCEQQGKAIFRLGDLAADAQHKGHSVTRITKVSHPPTATGWSVQFMTTSAPIRPVLCGDLTT